MKKCLTCSKHRHKCDGKTPTCDKCKAKGIECGGYGRNLRWTGAVASRGHLKDRKVPVLQVSDDVRPTVTIHQDPHVASVYIGPTSTSSDGASEIARVVTLKSREKQLLDGCSSTFYIQLPDPILQNLDRDSRFFLDYCR